MTPASAEQSTSVQPVDSSQQGSPPWSNWMRCESSFSMLLVPHRAGVFVLAEEVAALGAAGDDAEARRMLAVIHVAEADDLARAVSRIFSIGHPLREKVLTTPCFLRYAAMEIASERNMIAVALNRWLAEATAAANAIKPETARLAGAAAAPKSAGEPTAESRGALPASTQQMRSDILIDSDPGDETALHSVVEKAAESSPGNAPSRARYSPWRGPFPAGF